MDSTGGVTPYFIKLSYPPRFFYRPRWTFFIRGFLGALVFFLFALGSCASPPPAVLKDKEGFVKITPTPETRMRASISFGLTSAERTPPLGMRLIVENLKDSPLQVELFSTHLPAFLFRGILTFASDKEWVLQIDGVRIFDNWNNGWLEGEADAYGTLVGNLESPRTEPGQGLSQGTRWKGRLRDPLSLGEVKKGEVRYFDRYYRREEGQVRVEHRIRRLKALIQGTAGEKRMLGDYQLPEGKEGTTEQDSIRTAPALRAPLQKPPKDRREPEVEENPGLYVSIWNLDWFNARIQAEGVVLEEWN